MPESHRHRPPFASVLSLALALAFVTSSAAAQGSLYENPAFGFRMTLPGVWDVIEEVLADGTVSATATAPSGDEIYVIALQPLGPEDRARYASGTIEDIMTEVWDGFRPEVPGAQAQEYGEGTIAGARAAVLDYRGEGFAGALAVIDDEATLIVIAFVVADERHTEAGPRFYTALETIELASNVSAGHTEPPASTDPAAMTPDPPPATDPASDARNPLAPEPADAPVNPLAPPAQPDAPVNPLAVRPPFAGTFAGDGVELRLEATGESTYEGQITVAGATYPVNANALDATSIEGRFAVGATPFAFAATLDGDELELTSEGARYRLAR